MPNDSNKNRVITSDFVISNSDVSRCPNDKLPEYAFIGRSNVMPAKIYVDGNENGISFDEGYRQPMDNLIDVTDGQNVIVSVRPEELLIRTDGNGMKAKVVYSTFLGLNTHYMVEFGDGVRAEIIQESQIDDIIENGSMINLVVNPEKINVFTEDGRKSVVK